MQGAIVKVKIYDNQRNVIEREDTGVGTGTARTVGDAIDNASKSSVSDALKRSLRSLGSQFGNSLYSKDKNHTSNNQQYNNTQQSNNYQQQPQQQNYPPNNHQPQNQSTQAPYQNQQDFSKLTKCWITSYETR